jgi:hypothetical protein
MTISRLMTEKIFKRHLSRITSELKRVFCKTI